MGVCMNAMLVLILLILGALVTGVARSLITDEIRAWLPHLSRALVRHAAQRLSPEHRDRWQEEVLADLESFDDRPLTGFAHAVRVWLSKGELRSAVMSPRPELTPALRNFLRSWVQALKEITRFTAIVQVTCTTIVALNVGALVMTGALTDHPFLLVLLTVGLFNMLALSVHELRVLRRRSR